MSKSLTLTNASSLTLAAMTAVIALAAVPALAGDLSNGMPGGLKDSRGGAIPVPVPVPYEETYKYYVGGFVGWTFNSSGTQNLTADHMFAGGNGPSIPGYGDLNGPHTLSLVAGRYITPSIRGELSYDYRAPQRPLKGSNTQTYNGQLSGTLTDASTQTNTYAMTRTEDVTTQNHTFMLNAYYDLNRGGRFVPYIGAGIGFVRRDVTRTSTELAGTCTGVNSVSGAGACQNDANFPAPTATAFAASDDRVGFGFAAALMAGASYKLSERTHWDIGYRMMYEGGKVAVVQPSLGGFSSLNVGARLDHEVRTGLRFDIW